MPYQIGALRTSVLSTVLLFAPSLGFSQTTSSVLLAQVQTPPTAQAAVPAGPATGAPPAPMSKPKRWSVYWGWNRANYSKSDIHFTGSDHDFTLKNVEATDLQTDTSFKDIYTYYLNPAGLTIPQTNLRVAYQWNADTAIALNLDHMKYVVVQDQSVAIDGNIRGVNQSGDQVIADDWLNYEHTDGLNIVSLELEKQRQVDWFGSGHRSKVFATLGLGIVIPKSNVTMHMIGQSRNDEFHAAGYSASVGAGVEVDVYKDVFFRSAYKYGYVNLPDVLTSARGDKASQHFTFNELIVAVGLRF